LTIPRYQALQRQWRKTPPVPLLLARWLGVEEPSAPSTSAAEFETFYAAMTGSALT